MSVREIEVELRSLGVEHADRYAEAQKTHGRDYRSAFAFLAHVKSIPVSPADGRWIDDRIERCERAQRSLGADPTDATEAERRRVVTSEFERRLAEAIAADPFPAALQRLRDLGASDADLSLVVSRMQELAIGQVLYALGDAGVADRRGFPPHDWAFAVKDELSGQLTRFGGLHELASEVRPSVTSDPNDPKQDGPARWEPR